MEFQDIAFIVDIKKYSEKDAIIKVFTKNHGLFRGYVKKAFSKNNQAIFQIGNLISFQWKSRVEDSLGRFYYYDLEKSYLSKIIFDKLRLNCLCAIFAIIEQNFYEREKQEFLYQKIIDFLELLIADHANFNEIIISYIMIEIEILNSLGYGLDLTSCAVSEKSDDLFYVSPKSGRAVSKEHGQPYHDKLLILPNFLQPNFDFNKINDLSIQDLQHGFKLTGYFLTKFLNFSNKSKISARKIIENQIFSQ